VSTTVEERVAEGRAARERQAERDPVLWQFAVEASRGSASLPMSPSYLYDLFVEAVKRVDKGGGS
jgi:hypothetical protein